MEDVNVIIATYNDDALGDIQVGPEKGTVAFGSGLHGWGFNVERFAKIYASKMGVDKEKMMKRLWGDSFLTKEEDLDKHVAARGLHRALAASLLPIHHGTYCTADACHHERRQGKV